MLEPNEWSRLLSSIPERWQNLRRPAREQDLGRIESGLGRRLPESYRNFLLTGDGGFVGSACILGTVELAAGAPPEVPSGLLPFHPVGNGWECLDLLAEVATERGEEAPVVWWSPRSTARKTYTDFTDWVLDQMLEAVRT